MKRSHTPGTAASACVAILLFLALKPVQLIMPTADHVLMVCAVLLFGIYVCACELDKRAGSMPKETQQGNSSWNTSG